MTEAADEFRPSRAELETAVRELHAENRALRAALDRYRTPDTPKGTWELNGYGRTSTGPISHIVADLPRYDNQGRQQRAARSYCAVLLAVPEPARSGKCCQRCTHARAVLAPTAEGDQ